MSVLDATDFVSVLSTVAVLVLLEGLLSADNALVLAVMVRVLPKHEQKRALRYGVIGAFVFRLIAVVFASTLLHFWIVKAMGGVYLLWIAVSHLVFGEDNDAERKPKFGGGFWATVVSVELTDIMFSIDSILAAIATAEGLSDELGSKVLFTVPGVAFVVDVKLMVIYVGGILGIIAMRFVAGYFLILLDKFHGLAVGAYYLVAWIGLKLLGGGLNDALHPNPRFYVPAPGGWRDQVPAWMNRLPLDMNDFVFWAGMGLLVVASLLYQPKTKPIATEVIAEPRLEAESAPTPTPETL